MRLARVAPFPPPSPVPRPRPVACSVSWATWLLFTGVLAPCVVLRVRRPGPPGYALGLTAGGLISAGLTSVMASVTNLLRPLEEWHCGGTPIPSMMNFERRKGK